MKKIIYLAIIIFLLMNNLYAQPLWSVSRMDISGIRPFKIRVEDWNSPLAFAVIEIRSSNSKAVITDTTDIGGYCVVDFPDTFKNMQIRIIKEHYYAFRNPVYIKSNKILKSPAGTNIVSDRITSCYIGYDYIEFQYHSENMAELEKETKEKFKFRDVKQIDLRYKNIYQRF
jgi:hypothetical protein